MRLNKDDKKLLKFFQERGKKLTIKEIIEGTGLSWRSVIVKLSIFKKVGIIEGGKKHVGVYRLNDKFLKNTINEVENFAPTKEEIKSVLSVSSVDNIVDAILKKVSENGTMTIEEIKQNFPDTHIWKIQYSLYVLHMLDLISRTQRGVYEITENGRKYLLP